MSFPNLRPLHGVDVLDLSSEIAGPYCTKLFVDAGARVIKVEQDAGDNLRRWRASGKPIPEGQDGALFQFLNASKNSILLDLHDAQDRSMLLKLAAKADLIIEDFGPNGLEKFNLSYGLLSKENPALSLLSISPFGLSGPWTTRPCTEFTLQAATGSVDFRGFRNRKPLAAGGRIGEWLAGSFAATGAMAALLSARKTGRGQHVDLSIFESMLLGLTAYTDLSSQWQGGLLPRCVEIPSIEPAKDGWVGFCTVTEQQWINFCTLIEQPKIARDPRFFTPYQRMNHLEDIKKIIHNWTRKHSVVEIIERASTMRIPVAPVGNGKTLLDMDHLQKRGVFVKNPGGFLQPRIPYHLYDSNQPVVGPAPKLDQQRSEILKDLALTQAPRQEQVAPGDSNPLPLKGLKVIDLTAFWAGPFATSLLADLGAEVIKIESIQHPDGMRFANPAAKEQMWEWCNVFAGTNSGKKDITLQLDSAEGVSLLKQLIAKADVVIENFSVRVLEKFGLDWEVIHAINPATILVRMPAFGLDGPWRDRSGFAATMEQISGLAWLTGYQDTPLIIRGVCDPLGGMHAVFALFAALELRNKKGLGLLVESPLIEPALNVAAEQLVDYSAYGDLLSRDGNRGPAAAPQGLYRCKGNNSYIALAVANDEQWQKLCAFLKADDWVNDLELATEAGRRARHDEIDQRLDTWFSGYDVQLIESKLLSLSIPAQRVMNAHQQMPNPQLQHRCFFQTLTHPVTGETRYPNWPFNFSILGTQLRTTPPLLGQHNDEILGGVLGLTKTKLQELRDNKIIGEWPT